MGSEPSESPNWPYITHLANCRNRNSPIDSSDESNLKRKLRDRDESAFAVRMDAEPRQSSGCRREIQGRHELFGSGRHAHLVKLPLPIRVCRVVKNAVNAAAILREVVDHEPAGGQRPSGLAVGRDQA